MHRIRIEPVIHVPYPSGVDRGRRATVEDTVKIDTAGRRKACVKFGIDRCRRQHRDRIGSEMEVKRVPDGVRIRGLRKVDMSDLPERMHTRIGSASALNNDLF